MADYYTPGTPATPNTLARAENIAAELVTIAAAFDKIPEQLELEQDRAAYALDTGVADAYVVALPHPWASYTTGAALRVKIVNANTGSCTIDVDGLGVKAIKRHDGTDPEAGDLPAGSIKELFYTGSVMQVSTGTVTIPSTVAVANGGTGASTAAGARTNLGSGTVGDAIFQDTTAAAVRTEIGSTTVGDAIFIAASEAAARAAISLGTAALVDTGVTDGDVPAMDATGYPAADGSQITNVVAAWADVTGKKIAFYNFNNTSDVSITTLAPTGTLWSSSQSIVIPTSGLIQFAPYLRVDNSSGSSRLFYVGLRINGTDYWAQADNDGSPNLFSFTGSVSNVAYYTTRGMGNSSPAIFGLDIEGFGVSTGSQTVQPIIASSNASGTQTLRGTLVTSRLKVIVSDMG